MTQPVTLSLASTTLTSTAGRSSVIFVKTREESLERVYSAAKGNVSGRFMSVAHMKMGFICLMTMGFLMLFGEILS
jgi:hypothetical protein